MGVLTRQAGNFDASQTSPKPAFIRGLAVRGCPACAPLGISVIADASNASRAVPRLQHGFNPQRGSAVPLLDAAFGILKRALARGR